jgi:hypothetical protein
VRETSAPPPLLWTHKAKCMPITPGPSAHPKSLISVWLDGREGSAPTVRAALFQRSGLCLTPVFRFQRTSSGAFEKVRFAIPFQYVVTFLEDSPRGCAPAVGSATETFASLTLPSGALHARSRSNGAECSTLTNRGRDDYSVAR